jgi:hypothetical protein
MSSWVRGLDVEVDLTASFQVKRTISGHRRLAGCDDSRRAFDGRSSNDAAPVWLMHGMTG